MGDDMKALIVASGRIEDLKQFKKIVSENDFVLCADGGLDSLMKIRETPDLVLGDFDSISGEALEFIKEENIEFKKFPKEKNETDTELGILDIIKRGFKDITITGVTGSRMDHTMANIFLLKVLKNQGADGKIIDDNNTIYFVDDYLKLKKTSDYISIVPINNEGICISLKGFFYPLDKYHLDFGSTQGISNLIEDDFGIIKIHSGEALVFQSRD